MDKEIRRCNHCGKPMKEGYVWGEEYYCSSMCLDACYSKYEQEHSFYPEMGEKESAEDYTEAELEKMFYAQDECYWTTWDSIYLDF